MSATLSDAEVDARGLHCPLPILRAKRALAGLASGQTLAVQTTDVSAVLDFQAFCRQTGHGLLSQTEAGDVTIHLLRKR